MASAPQTYKKGKQDIREQNATFALFWGLTKWGVIIVILIMILLAYLFT
ncbi:MAG: aa3-type cytochrome c oxidase subunit IV [Alphaproteobacteria bacterium]|nr:aa3-type cytochrome c oxidase subunit IV [Alphaproteobacteria bacterium]